MRILVTGLGTFWGSRLAKYLETQPVRRRDRRRRHPRAPRPARADRVRAGRRFLRHPARIVRAAQIDTILHTHLVVDSTEVSGRAIHETNVIEHHEPARRPRAPRGARSARSCSRASTLLYGSNFQDPYFFREEIAAHAHAAARVSNGRCSRSHRCPRLRRGQPAASSSRNSSSQTCSAATSTARSRASCAGPSSPRSSASTPGCSSCTRTTSPASLAVRDAAGRARRVYNVAGEGVLPWSEVCAIVGKRRVAMPPVATAWSAEPLRLARIVDMAPELLEPAPLRPRRRHVTYRPAGFRYQYTTRRDRRAPSPDSLRLERNVGESLPSYRYERDIEAFFHHSPAVLRNGDVAPTGEPPGAGRRGREDEPARTEPAGPTEEVESAPARRTPRASRRPDPRRRRAAQRARAATSWT